MSIVSIMASLLSTPTTSSFLTLTVAPAKVIRGAGVLRSSAISEISTLGNRPLIVTGKHTLNI